MPITSEELKISIIIPVFNAKEYLPHCIDSILNQTLRNFELILVDDGSTDGSSKLCDFYAKDSRVKVIHKKNEGPSVARNCGIEAAQGEYIGFVDADDWCEPNMFEELLSAASSNDADMAFCNYTLDTEAGSKKLKTDYNGNHFYSREEISEKILPYFFGYTNEELKSYKSYFPFADYSSYIWLCIYKTSVLKENKITFPSQKNYYNEDNLFNLNFVFHAKSAVHVEKSLYHYRESSVSLTKRYNPKFFDAKLNKFKYLRNFIKTNLASDYDKRLCNKICVESINIINYYIYASNESLIKKHAKIRKTINSPIISSALKELDLSHLSPFSRLGVFFRLEKHKAYFILLILCEVYKRIRR